MYSDPPLHSCFPIVFIKNSFFLLLVLVLFIVPQSLTRPVCVILILEQTIRADEHVITVHLDYASPRVCLLTHRIHCCFELVVAMAMSCLADGISQSLSLSLHSLWLLHSSALLLGVLSS